jgi:hypothetical protein
VRGEAARRVEAFFLEPDVQQSIADFGRERFGRPLFRPLLLEGTAPSGAGDAPKGADAP